MAPPSTSFSSYVQDVVINYASLLNKEQQASIFNRRRENFSGAMLAKELNRTQNIFNTQTSNQISNAVQTPALTSQKVKLTNIYGKKAASAITNPMRIDASGNVPVYEDDVIYFNDGYSSGMSYTAMQNILRTGGTLSYLQNKEQRAVDLAKQHVAILIEEMALDIYSKFSADVNTFIAASRWKVSASPDPASSATGMYIPVAGNYKQIPVADAPFVDATKVTKFLSVLRGEANKNSFARNSRCLLYGDFGADLFFQRPDAMGANNQQNESLLKTAANFDFMYGNELTAINPADAGLLYMIAPGSVAFFQQAPIPTYINQETGEMGVKAGNDTWEIPYLYQYTNCILEIYATTGQMLYRSIGYPKNWDGKYNGNDLPTGTYYYVIDPKNGRQKLTGYITILR